MIEFAIIIAIVIILYLIFGKADTKRELLNAVGLDLSQEHYENKKEYEFQNYAIKAMKKVIDLDDYESTNEKEFLDFMLDKLCLAIYGEYVVDDIGLLKHKSLYLGVKKHYIKHAEKVIERRKEDMHNGKNTALSKSVSFSNKKSAKKYCDILWDKYQYPWPDNWMQNDSDL